MSTCTAALRALPALARSVFKIKRAYTHAHAFMRAHALEGAFGSCTDNLLSGLCLTKRTSFAQKCKFLS